MGRGRIGGLNMIKVSALRAAEDDSYAEGYEAGYEAGHEYGSGGVMFLCGLAGAGGVLITIIVFLGFF